jgi:hypothetical protein
MGEFIMPLVDFAIVTGLVEEFETVRQVFPELLEWQDEDENDIWYRGRVTASNGVSYEVVASHMRDMAP